MMLPRTSVHLLAYPTGRRRINCESASPVLGNVLSRQNLSTDEAKSRRSGSKSATVDLFQIHMDIRKRHPLRADWGAESIRAESGSVRIPFRTLTFVVIFLLGL